jgi:two-component system sensor histidine kinase SenX3
MTMILAIVLAVLSLALAVLIASLAVALRRRSGRVEDLERDGRATARQADRLASELAARDTVLSAMTEGVVLFDADGDVAYANEAARGILGRRFGSVRELTPSVLRDAVLAAREPAQSRTDGRQWSMLARIQDQDHPKPASGDGADPDEPTVRHFESVRGSVEATIVPSSPRGTLIVLARDVSSAGRVERLRRDFVANASHELKTPVASILAIAETLRHAADSDPAARERFLALLEEEANRLSRLVRDLLELSRLEGEPRPPERVRLDRVLVAEAERLRGRAEAAGLSLTVDPVQPAEVLGSPADLGLLIHNLLDNAVRYTESGGRIRASLVGEPDASVIRVEDSGIGIPSKDLDRVFERFYRVDPARSRETGGTGLGLSIVRHVAGSHGGEVHVDSVLGAGSTFAVRLPLAPAPDEGTDNGPSEHPSVPERLEPAADQPPESAAPAETEPASPASPASAAASRAGRSRT